MATLQSVHNCSPIVATQKIRCVQLRSLSAIGALETTWYQQNCYRRELTPLQRNIVIWVVAEEQWPVQWKGGRLKDVHKRKGDPQVCTNSRGVLIADHSWKGLFITGAIPHKPTL